MNQNTSLSHNFLAVLAKTMGSNVLASTLWVMAISCIWVLPASASDAAWSYVLDYKAEGTTQNSALSFSEWGRAGCGEWRFPPPSVCYEKLSIDTSVYFGRKTILKNNNRLLWVLFDYSRQSHQNNQSNAHYLEIDCERLAYLELKKYGYDQPMGKGPAEVKTNSKDWDYPPPNTVFLKILQAACNR